MTEAPESAKAPSTVHNEEGYRYCFFGDLVAVRSKLQRTTEVFTDSIGRRHEVPVCKGLAPDSTPSIVFCSLREYDGDSCLQEECSVEGGMSGEGALELADNIKDAVAFIKAGCVLPEDLA